MAKHSVVITTTILLTLCSLVTAFNCYAQGKGAAGPKLPELTVFTTYEVGATTYVQAAAMADGVTKKTGMKFRLMSQGGEIGRVNGIRSGQAHFTTISGGAAYFVINGLHEFGAHEWGPQPLRQLLAVLPAGATTFAAGADANIKTPYDLKGKKIPWIPSSPSINTNHEAILAFAGLTWNDVKRVAMPSFGAAGRALIEGKIDLCIANPTAPFVIELASSSRGISWPEFPADDKAAWDRMMKVAPYFVPYTMAIDGPGLSKTKPVRVINFHLPVIAAYDKLSDDIAYAMIKAVNESFPMYKDAYPNMPAWELKKCVNAKGMILPYHSGAVKYLKEIGLWTKEMDAKQEKLVADQAKMKKVWAQALSEATSKGIKDKDFTDFWMKKRDEAF